MKDIHEVRIRAVDAFLSANTGTPFINKHVRLQREEKSGATIVRFTDRNILDEANIKDVFGEIMRVIDSETSPKVIISFENVDHLSSAALGHLIASYNKIREKRGQMCLCDLDQIYEVFASTRLNRLFKIYSNLAEAVTAFS